MWKLFVLTLAVVSVNGIAALSETQEFDAKGLTELDLQSTTGKISITAVDAPKASVTTNKIVFSDKCKLTMNRTGNKLVVELKQSGMFGGTDCTVDFDVKVPKSLDVDLKLGAGQVDLKGTHGELECKVGSGDISADGTFSKVEAKSGSGKLELKGLTGEGEINVGSGSVRLTYAEKPTKGELEVRVGSGPATVFFPKGSAVKTSFKSGTGELSNELGDTPNSDFRLDARSGTGDLNVKAY